MRQCSGITNSGRQSIMYSHAFLQAYKSDDYSATTGIKSGQPERTVILRLKRLRNYCSVINRRGMRGMHLVEVSCAAIRSVNQRVKTIRQNLRDVCGGKSAPCPREFRRARRRRFLLILIAFQRTGTNISHVL